MSIFFLVAITLWLVVEAIDRVKHPRNVKGKEMLITASCGLVFNIVQMWILHQGDGHFHLGQASNGPKSPRECCKNAHDTSDEGVPLIDDPEDPDN